MTEAVVSNTAVAELDDDEGTASVIVVFTATSVREGEEDIAGRQAMRVDLAWEDDQWKATEVSQVGVTVPLGAAGEEADGGLDDLGQIGDDAESDDADTDGDDADTDADDDADGDADDDDSGDDEDGQ